jgi:Calcineurin-like phosphoesterase
MFCMRAIGISGELYAFMANSADSCRQQWLNGITTKIPYMVIPGNHEASCAEFDGPNNELTAYLDNNEPASTAPESSLTYYSCPPSQRNFTAYQNRFHMAGEKSGGVGNFWYSYDYGMTHFISIDGETDFPYSPEWPFVRDDATGLPTEKETYVTDSGPFGTIDGNQWKDLAAYEQYKWLINDLKNIDRCKTPWVVAMSHR